MHLIKWLRKNNTKLMAVVVIVLMIAFIGGSSLDYLLRGKGGLYKPIAYFADNKKITPNDQLIARGEIDILRAMRANALLQSRDFQGVLLGELLFSEGRGTPAMINLIKRFVRTNQYRVSDKQIEDIYRHSVPPDIYWLLLKNEAQSAGISVPNKDMADLLGRVSPELFEGRTYPQVMASLVNQSGMPEEQILATLGKLVAVLQYSYTICSTNAVTDSQIRHTASWNNETIDVNFVRFDSALFARTAGNPPEENIISHFEKYKKFFAGQVSDENPYGFGYKLPDRVRLDYIVVKLDDVSSIIPMPTEEEAEQYYRKNREQLFTKKTPKDPNDPNSPVVTQTKGYAEVADSITQQLKRERITSKAEQILQEIKIITDSGLESALVQDANLTSEQLKKLAGDYQKAAEETGKKYGIKLHSGQTGLLSGIDMQADEQLGRLYITAYGYNPIRLSQVVFSTNELEPNEPAALYGQKPKMYESIGPVEDPLGQIAKTTGPEHNIMALVRITEVQKACEPANVDVIFSTKTLEFGQTVTTETKEVYSVREKVVEDVKRLAAFETTKNKADEFAALATKDGWDNAVKKFNELDKQKDPNDPNSFKLETLAGLQRVSQARLEFVAIQNRSNPIARWLNDQARAQRQFVDQLYSLIPPDSNTVKQTPVIFDFKPNLSWYCVKNISVKRLNQEEYQANKIIEAMKEDQVQSQSLAAVHYNPDNILKRMNYRPARERAKSVNTTTPLEKDAEL